MRFLLGKILNYNRSADDLARKILFSYTTTVVREKDGGKVAWKEVVW
jgi:hypothetical protein